MRSEEGSGPDVPTQLPFFFSPAASRSGTWAGRYLAKLGPGSAVVVGWVRGAGMTLGPGFGQALVVRGQFEISRAGPGLIPLIVI